MYVNIIPFHSSNRNEMVSSDKRLEEQTELERKQAEEMQAVFIPWAWTKTDNF